MEFFSALICFCFLFSMKLPSFRSIPDRHLGSTRREYAAMKLAIYSFAGSAMVLIGLLAAYTTAGSQSTGLVELARAGLPVSFQMWCFPLVFTGFAILAGMCPFTPGRHRPRRRADGRVDAAGRRGDEAGCLRLPARRHRSVSARP